MTWNNHVNLVGPRERGVFWTRHIEDSLALIPHLPQGIDRFTDIGSGGGLPGIPIAIATGFHVDLVEADRRKAAFLETALTSLQLKGRVWADRIEDTSAPRSCCLVARALAPLEKLLRLAHPLVTNDAVVLFIKGRHVEQEIDAATKTWDMNVEVLPGASCQSLIVKVRKFSLRGFPS